MIDLFKKIPSSYKKIIAIISLALVVFSYKPMYCTYKLYVQWWDLIIALLGGLAILLIHIIYRPKNSLFYLLWIAVVAIYFYLHIIYFESKNLRASTILSVIGSVVILTPFIISNFKRKKTVDIKRPEVYLGRTRAYNRIHFRIRRMTIDSEGKAIALYGRWGSGKSHCIQFLSHRLQNKFERTEYDDSVTRDPASPLNKVFEEPFEICNISLWNYKTVDEAWTAIINELYYTITGNRVIDVHGALSRLLNLLPKGEFLSALIDYIRLPHGNQNDDWSGVISDEIGKERRVLLIFDDIERAPYEIIRNLLPLIERLKAIEGMVILCAIADDELVKVYQEHGVNADSLYGYLSKIFDFPFYLPEPSYHAIREIETKLIEKKYKDFPLLTTFLKIFELKYDTPRQIERIMEKISGIELQYLYDATLLDMDDYDARFKQKEFCIFLVEILRLLYKSVLAEINHNGKKLLCLSKLFSKIKAGKNAYNYSSSDDDTNEEEKFKQTYPVTANYTSSDSLIESILRPLSNYESTDIQSAIKMVYARRSTLSLRECDDIVSLRNNYKYKNVKELILNYFKNDPACLDSIEMAIHDLIDHCIENVYKASYAQFLSYIYTYDPPNDSLCCIFSKNFHNNNDARFMHLLNTCGDYMNKVESRNSICSAIRSILCHSFPSNIHRYLYELLQLDIIQYPWCGETYYLNNQTLSLIRTHIINEIIASYSESMISFIFTNNYIDIISHKSNHHEVFHIYDDSLFDKFKSIIQGEINKYLSSVTHEENNLYKVLVYLLCEAKFDKHRGILAVKTSKWIVDTLNPWLNECLQKVHLSPRITDKIPEWLKRINTSRELWNTKSEGAKYVDGANELLSIMEKLKRKANQIE